MEWVGELQLDQEEWDILCLQECYPNLTGSYHVDSQGNVYVAGVHIWRNSIVVVNKRWEPWIQSYNFAARHPQVVVRHNDIDVCVCSVYSPQVGLGASFYEETWNTTVMECQRTNYDTLILAGDLNGHFASFVHAAATPTIDEVMGPHILSSNAVLPEREAGALECLRVLGLWMCGTDDPSKAVMGTARQWGDNEGEYVETMDFICVERAQWHSEIQFLDWGYTSSNHRPVRGSLWQKHVHQPECSSSQNPGRLFAPPFFF